MPPTKEAASPMTRQDTDSGAEQPRSAVETWGPAGRGQ